MSDNGISYVTEKAKDCACRCYKDRRIWIMVSLILTISFISSVVIFQIDIGSNIVYGFILFWSAIFSLMGVGLYKATINVKNFCAESKDDRHEDYLIGAGIIFTLIIVASMLIVVFVEDNYQYWMIERGLPQETTTTRTLSDCSILRTVTTEESVNFLEDGRYSWSRPSHSVTTSLGTDPDCEPVTKDLTKYNGLTDDVMKNNEIRDTLNLPSEVKSESAWRRAVETLDSQRAEEIIFAKKEMNLMDCHELFEYRFADEFGLQTPERVWNSHRLVDLGCDKDKDWYIPVLEEKG